MTILERTQKVATSSTPTGGELPFSKLLVKSFSTSPTQPAVLLHFPGCAQQLCSGSTLEMPVCYDKRAPEQKIVQFS